MDGPATPASHRQNSGGEADGNASTAQPAVTGRSNLPVATQIQHEDAQEQPASRPSSASSHESIEPYSPNDDHDDPDKRTSKELETTTRPRSIDARSTTSSQSGPVYSIFNRRQKRYIVVIATATAFLSPVSGVIYFPALNQLSEQLHVSSGTINLTLTTYMIMQGLAPTFFGDFADSAGRRPAYILGLVIYIAANIGCALAPNFAALLVLRMLQSTGSSGTIALASGIAADISVAAERGTYMGWVLSGAMVGPAIGPVLGGILSQYWGWQGIFWFLTIVSGIIFAILLVFLPETCRNIVGNGSIPAQGWNMSLLSWLRARKARVADKQLQRVDSTSSSTPPPRRRVRFPNPLKSFAVMTEKDVGLLLLFNSVNFAAFYQLTGSLPYLFGQIYGYNDLQIGLCFIPFGIGSFLAPWINGPLLDWRFRVVAQKAGIPLDKKRSNSMKGFPLEQARIPVAAPMAVVASLTLICYGWALEKNSPLPGPLVLTFILGLTFTSSSNVSSTMLVDYYPQSPSTVTAANNLGRCWLGAGATAIIIYMINGLGRGWCFTLIGLVMLLTTPCLLVLLKYGPGWREARRVKQDEARAASDREKA